MKTTTSAALAAAHRLNPDRWSDGFGALLDRIRPRFARHEPLRHAGALMLGLLSGLDRKNCWTIAEHRGDATPDGLQHLLSRAKWDADAVRDDVRGYVDEHLGDAAGILVVDETGDVKKGVHTVGTQRQYTGTAGRIENAQVAVYLTYAAPRGHALIDRALYLPSSWADDPGRLAEAGVPADVAFATKPALALQMIGAALDAGVPARFVAAALRRPLQLPTVGKGQPCPVTLAQHQPDPALGLVQGDGPAGPVGLSEAGVLQYVSPAEGTAFSDNSWGGQKVLWAVNSAVDGPVLVRGGQLDGAHEVRFEDPAVGEMLLPPKPPITAGGWRDYPSYTRLQAPGCYAYQVDTPTGTTVIIFRAEGPDLLKLAVSSGS